MKIIVQLSEDADDQAIVGAIRLMAGVLDVAVDGAKMTRNERNDLLQALAALDSPNTDELGKSGWGRVVKALQTIQEVSPGVTAGEINRRAHNFVLAWPNATISSTALASHWGRFGVDASKKPTFQPHWKMIYALKEQLAKHPANPQWVGYVRGSETKEQIEEYRALKARVEEMEREP